MQRVSHLDSVKQPQLLQVPVLGVLLGVPDGDEVHVHLDAGKVHTMGPLLRDRVAHHGIHLLQRHAVGRGLGVDLYLSVRHLQGDSDGLGIVAYSGGTDVLLGKQDGLSVSVLPKRDDARGDAVSISGKTHAKQILAMADVDAAVHHIVVADEDILVVAHNFCPRLPGDADVRIQHRFQHVAVAVVCCDAFVDG